MRWSLRSPNRGCPGHRRPQRLISQPAPGWTLEHWFNCEPLPLQDLRGKVVLVRWFMAPSCPPALNRFDEEYRGRGLA